MRLLRPPSREGPAAQHRSSWPVAARPKGLCQRHYYNYGNTDSCIANGYKDQYIRLQLKCQGSRTPSALRRETPRVARTRRETGHAHVPQIDETRSVVYNSFE